MIRRQHWLAGNKGTPSPHNVVYVDTETKERRRSPVSVSHHLWFGWACHERSYGEGKWTSASWKRFTTRAQFWTWLEGKTRDRTRLYCFAHNWNFDALVLGMFDELPARGWTLAQCVVEGPPTIMVWRKGERCIEFLDTLNWWRMSLAAIGKGLGFPKLPFPSRTASKRTWDRYGKQDVEVVRRVVREWLTFIKAYDLGGFARTLAAQSMRAYRHRFLEHPILIDANPRATSLARESYHGGRTECFRLGRIEGPIHCLDVNSMYPAVMRDEEYPTVLRLWSRSVTIPELTRYLKTYAIVARVTVQTPEPCFAVVQGDKLIFPVGRYETVLTTPDIKYGMSKGYIRRVREVAVYDRAQIFRSFVETLYALRQTAGREGREVDKWMLKILLNSLYGKFAQRGIQWQTIGDDPEGRVGAWVEHDADTGQTRSYRAFAGVLQERSRDPESYSSHPAIASHVTAYARRLLWSLITKAGQDNVLYSDTDSLYVTDQGLERLRDCIDPDALGALKHEASYPWIVLRGPKDYETPKGKTIKGVRSSAKWVSPSTVEQEQWSSIRGRIRGSDLSAPTTTTVRKTLSRRYAKGTPTPSGRVSPFRLDTPDGDGTV